MQFQLKGNGDVRHRVGRPRRGTVQERNDALIAAATRVFLRDGYGLASIDKVASEAGVSTRTIYQRFKNKADLMVAVVTRLIDRDMMTVLSSAELDGLSLKEALLTIGHSITSRARNPDVASLFRILATEAIRFPELAAKMRESTTERISNEIEKFFLTQIARGALQLANPARAASLFMQVVCAEMHEWFLFGAPPNVSDFDFRDHVVHAVDLFLYGALPRVESVAKSVD